MLLKIEMQNVRLDDYEVLEALRSALRIDSDWYLQDGEVFKDDPYVEHSRPESVDFSPEVFKAFLTIKNYLNKKRKSKT